MADALGLSSGAVDDQRVDSVRPLKHLAQLKHTPGPWLTEGVGVPSGTPMVYAGRMRICDIRGWGYLTGGGAMALPPEQAAEIQDANARLIAAAPNLLKMLERILLSAVPNERDHPTMYPAWKDAQALIDSLFQSANAVNPQPVEKTGGSANT